VKADFSIDIVLNYWEVKVCRRGWSVPCARKDVGDFENAIFESWPCCTDALLASSLSSDNGRFWPLLHAA
jgi:hypothetical protein